MGGIAKYFFKRNLTKILPIFWSAEFTGTRTVESSFNNDFSLPNKAMFVSGITYSVETVLKQVPTEKEF